MRNPPGRSATGAVLLLCVFTRLFWGMTVEASIVHVSAWLCPLIGFLLFLPLGLLEARLAARAGSLNPLQYLEKRMPAWIMQSTELMVLFILIADCAMNMRLLAGIANVLALNSLPLPVLLLPLGGMLAVSVLSGAEAAGNSARIWNRLLLPLLVIAAIVHLKDYEPRWLAPLLGGGTASLLKGSLYCGGCIALLSTPALLSVPDRKRHFPLRNIALAAVFAALTLAAQQMLAPAQTGIIESHTSRIRAVLSNGRTRLPMQMLLMVIAYGSLMQLLCAEGTTCAGFLEHSFPGAKRWLMAFGVGLAAILLASTAASAYEMLRRIALPAAGLAALLLLLNIRRRRST